uniref:Uncharacterized protein n=1 Tax=Anguilla anguilla TaxID=7936 RepID=A0A0E9TI32_ANGAN
MPRPVSGADCRGDKQAGISCCLRSVFLDCNGFVFSALQL